MTEWLACNGADAERRPDRVREEQLVQFRSERIEPPTVGRVMRMVRSALRTAERDWSFRIAGRLADATTGRLLSLIAPDEDGGQGGDPVARLGLIRSMPGAVSLESMMAESGKLRTVRAVGLPAGLFADVAPKVRRGGAPALRWNRRRTCVGIRSRWPRNCWRRWPTSTASENELVAVLGMSRYCAGHERRSRSETAGRLGRG